MLSTAEIKVLDIKVQVHSLRADNKQLIESKQKTCQSEHFE